MSWNDCPICCRELIFDKSRASILCTNGMSKTVAPHYEVLINEPDYISSEFVVIDSLEIQRTHNRTIVREPGFYRVILDIDITLPLNIERIKKLLVLG